MNQAPNYLDDRCSTCADTGHWSGEPLPCPECGVYISRHVKDEFPSLRYIEKHAGQNRRERRAKRKR